MKLLKLGGSVVTYKEKELTPNTGNIRRLAQEIKKVLPQKMVIIHGGGSFGHPLAKEFEINEGLRSAGQLLGFSKTHQAMASLNNLIVDELLDVDVPAFGLSPSSFIITSNRRIRSLNIEVISNILDLGIIPILYGDAVIDEKQGIAILSGDQLIVELAIKLEADKLIFGSDVDGLYTSDPKLDSQAKLVKKITVEQLQDLYQISGSLKTDVTGGMLGKIKEASGAVKSGIEVCIVNALKPCRVKKAILGENVKGTCIII